MTVLATYFLLALGISLALVPLFRLAAFRLGYVAKPREDRWHRQPTAMFGGVAIAFTTLGIALAAPERSKVWLLLACGALIFVVGLTDDVRTLKPGTKLVAQIGLASVFVFFGYRLQWVESLTLDTLLSMVWIVGLTNAFNLLDNMDGLCAGVAMIAGAGLLAAMLLGPGPGPESLYLAVLLGAVGGFLVYNVHPASIFIGDSGSLFIGMTLAVLALRSAAGEPTASEVLSIVAAPMLVLLVPIFDTTLVTISRLLSGRHAMQGGRDHPSHRLVAIGLSERGAVAVLWALAAAAGLAGIAVRHFGGSWGVVPAAIFVVAMVIFAVYLAQVRVYEEPDEALIRSGTITLFVVNLVYKRRIAEVLLDFWLISIAYYAAYRLRFEGPQFAIHVRTMRKRLRRSMKAVAQWCQQHRHDPVEVQAAALNAKLRGHYQYYGRPTNYRCLWEFYRAVRRRWHKWLNRRSRRKSLNWAQFNSQLLRRHPLLQPRITHAWASSGSPG